MPIATIEDLARVPENGKAELVDGQIVLLPRDGFLPGFVAGEIKSSLRAYGHHTHSGYALGGTVVFLVNLPNRKSFSPDAAFFTGKPTGMRFLEEAPIFAVEVRSEGDYGPAAEAEISAKRADYFAAGTEVVWDVAPLSEDVVRVYRASAPDYPTIYRRADTAEAEPAVPGWSMAVEGLFPYYVG